MSRPSRNGPCPCGSGRKAKGCCLPVIDGARPAATPVELLRARYTAYGLGATRFLIATTDPAGGQWRSDGAAWESDLRDYCARLELVSLEVIEVGPARVKYRAYLQIDGVPVTLAEDARYRHASDGWRYVDGQQGV